MNIEIPEKRSCLWKSYFMMCGVISLISWNSVLNLIDYFNNFLSANIFVYISFVFCLGTTVSFLIGPFMFEKVSYKKSINISLIMVVLTFLATFLMIEYVDNKELQIYSTLVFIFICGFFGSFFQSKTTGLAVSISNRELVYFNFGTGIAGFVSNIIAFIFNKLYPYNTSDPSTLTNLTQQVNLYLILIVVIFLFYFVLDFVFEKKYKVDSEEKGSNQEHLINNPLESDSEVDTDTKALTSSQIIRRTIDLLMGLIFQYVIVISLVSYFLAEGYYKFDTKGDSLFTIPAYLFFFNLADAIGKFLPPRTFIKSSTAIHFWNFIRFSFIIYFMGIIGSDNPPEVLSSEWTRAVIFFVSGVTNGYFTNCFMGTAANRFSRPAEKNIAGYFSVLFLLLGISIGSFMGIVYTADLLA